MPLNVQQHVLPFAAVLGHSGTRYAPPPLCFQERKDEDETTTDISAVGTICHRRFRTELLVIRNEGNERRHCCTTAANTTTPTADSKPRFSHPDAGAAGKRGGSGSTGGTTDRQRCDSQGRRPGQTVHRSAAT